MNDMDDIETVIWRSAFRQFASNSEKFSSKCIQPPDMHSKCIDDGGEEDVLTTSAAHSCDLCGNPGYFIVCFSENCINKCHINCEFFSRDVGLIIDDNGDLQYYCKQHFQPGKFCTCDQSFDDESRVMLHCTSCMNWFHGSCVGETLKDKVDTSVAEFVCHNCRLLIRNGHKISESIRSKNLDKEDQCARHQIAIKSVKTLTHIEASIGPIIDGLLKSKQRFSPEQLQRASSFLSSAPTSMIKKSEVYLADCFNIFGCLDVVTEWKSILDRNHAEFNLWIKTCTNLIDEICQHLLEFATKNSNNNNSNNNSNNNNNNNSSSACNNSEICTSNGIVAKHYIFSRELLEYSTKSCAEIEGAWHGVPKRICGGDAEAISLHFCCISWTHAVISTIKKEESDFEKHASIVRETVYGLLADGLYLLNILKVSKLANCLKLLPFFETFFRLSVEWYVINGNTGNRSSIISISISSNSGNSRSSNNSNSNSNSNNNNNSDYSNSDNNIVVDPFSCSFKSLRSTYMQKFDTDSFSSGTSTLSNGSRYDCTASKVNSEALLKFRKARSYPYRCSRAGCFSAPLTGDDMYCSDHCAHASVEESLQQLLQLRKHLSHWIVDQKGRYTTGSGFIEELKLFKDCVDGISLKDNYDNTSKIDFRANFRRTIENLIAQAIGRVGDYIYTIRGKDSAIAGCVAEAAIFALELERNIFAKYFDDKVTEDTTPDASSSSSSCLLSRKDKYQLHCCNVVERFTLSLAPLKFPTALDSECAIDAETNSRGSSMNALRGSDRATLALVFGSTQAILKLVEETYLSPDDYLQPTHLDATKNGSFHQANTAKSIDASGGAERKDVHNDRSGVCFAWQKSECNRGSSCRYSHSIATTDGVYDVATHDDAARRKRPRADEMSAISNSNSNSNNKSSNINNSSSSSTNSKSSSDVKKAPQFYQSKPMFFVPPKKF